MQAFVAAGLLASGAPLGGRQPRFGLVGAAAQRVDPRALDRDRRVPVERLAVESLEPRLDRAHAPRRRDGHGDRAEDAGGALLVAGRVRVDERRLEIALRLEPVGRALVEHRHQLRLALRELLQQQLAEEMVEAERAAVAVERDDEQVRLLERGELQRRAFPVEDGVAERAAHRLEHGAPAKERQPVGLEPREVLRAEVVGEVAVGAGDRDDVPRVARVALCARGERCQVEAGRPAFGVLHQLVDLGVLELQRGGAQQHLGLAPAEGELVRPELEQRPAGPQRGHRQVGHDPTGEHDHRPGRDMPDERSDGRDRVVRQGVRAVEHEHERRAARCDRRAEALQCLGRRGPALGGQRLERRLG